MARTLLPACLILTAIFAISCKQEPLEGIPGGTEVHYYLRTMPAEGTMLAEVRIRAEKPEDSLAVENLKKTLRFLYLEDTLRPSPFQGAGADFRFSGNLPQPGDSIHFSCVQSLRLRFGLKLPESGSILLDTFRKGAENMLWFEGEDLNDRESFLVLITDSQETTYSLEVLGPSRGGRISLSCSSCPLLPGPGRLEVIRRTESTGTRGKVAQHLTVEQYLKSADLMITD